MTLDEYQLKAAETDLGAEVDYYIHGLSSEAGEVAAYRKRALRGDADCGDLIGELGDVLWYLAAVADMYGVQLSNVAEYNLTKLRKRKEAGTIAGSGENRGALL